MTAMQAQKIANTFQIPGTVNSIEQLKEGHINSTFLLHMDTGDCILQVINTAVFKNPVGMMDNICNCTEFIREKMISCGENPDRMVLRFAKVKEGNPYYRSGDDFYRMYRFVPNSVTYNVTSDLHVIEEAGKAFGKFQMYLSDYPAKTLTEVIPDFHNTVKRFDALEKAISADVCKRKSLVAKEIEGFRNLRDLACKMTLMQQSGELPTRVTHNDTKTNNVLFDQDTGEHLAVIDLDTIMPGLCGFDFGDAIRFIGNTCAEDEPDTFKVALDLSKFEAFTKGFVGTVGKTLTDQEKETLALGAVTMTSECGSRFLSDYLSGDTYFKIAYPDHNLVRANCQLALANDMVKHLDEMNEIVRKYC